MRDIDLDDRDGPDEDEMRRIREPVCDSCHDRVRRVVKWGMCAECVEVTECGRAERRAS